MNKMEILASLDMIQKKDFSADCRMGRKRRKSTVPDTGGMDKI